jgi:hypothetical protein
MHRWFQRMNCGWTCAMSPPHSPKSTRNRTQALARFEPVSADTRCRNLLRALPLAVATAYNCCLIAIFQGNTH